MLFATKPAWGASVTGEVAGCTTWTTAMPDLVEDPSAMVYENRSFPSASPVAHPRGSYVTVAPSVVTLPYVPWPTAVILTGRLGGAKPTQSLARTSTRDGTTALTFVISVFAASGPTHGAATAVSALGAGGAEEASAAAGASAVEASRTNKSPSGRTRRVMEWSGSPVAPVTDEVSRRVQRLSDGGDGTTGHSWPATRRSGPRQLQQSHDPSALAPVGLQQLQHPLIGAAAFAGKRPGDHARDVEVPHADGVRIAERPDAHLRRGPRADPGEGPERPIRRLTGVGGGVRTGGGATEPLEPVRLVRHGA